jgi:hypothetical protein
MSERQPASQFLIYRSENGTLKIDVRFEDETVWLTQQLMANLFQTTQQNISLHLQNIFEEGELDRSATHKECLSVRQEGARQVSRAIDHYNLDAIISVGYRIKSSVATQFRIWATQRLRDYFEELLRRIQDIRTSERRFYQKITDIYATSLDYDPTTEASLDFFKTVQNKMHWAVTGQTAAEILHARADRSRPNMGLTSWRGAKVRKEDVAIAKNYLSEPELAALNNLVEQYLLFAEGQAMRRIPMHMQTWINKLDAFLQLNERDILTHAGRMSHDLAVQHAQEEYDDFHRQRLADEPRLLDELEDRLGVLPPPRTRRQRKPKDGPGS